jgi:hypothetical protein
MNNTRPVLPRTFSMHDTVFTHGASQATMSVCSETGIHPMLCYGRPPGVFRGPSLFTICGMHIVANLCQAVPFLKPYLSRVDVAGRAP